MKALIILSSLLLLAACGKKKDPASENNQANVNQSNPLQAPSDERLLDDQKNDSKLKTCKYLLEKYLQPIEMKSQLRISSVKEIPRNRASQRYALSYMTTKVRVMDLDKEGTLNDKVVQEVVFRQKVRRHGSPLSSDEKIVYEKNHLTYDFKYGQTIPSVVWNRGGKLEASGYHQYLWNVKRINGEQIIAFSNSSWNKVMGKVYSGISIFRPTLERKTKNGLPYYKGKFKAVNRQYLGHLDRSSDGRVLNFSLLSCQLRGRVAYLANERFSYQRPLER